MVAASALEKLPARHSAISTSTDLRRFGYSRSAPSTVRWSNSKYMRSSRADKKSAHIEMYFHFLSLRQHRLLGSCVAVLASPRRNVARHLDEFSIVGADGPGSSQCWRL